MHIFVTVLQHIAVQLDYRLREKGIAKQRKKGGEGDRGRRREKVAENKRGEERNKRRMEGRGN